MPNVIAFLIAARARMELHDRDQLLSAMEAKLEEMVNGPNAILYAVSAAKDAVEDLRNVKSEADVIQVAKSWMERTEQMDPGPERVFISQVGALLLRTKI